MEEVQPQNTLANRAAPPRCLQRLAQLLPPQVAPIVVADAGFKVPLHRGRVPVLAGYAGAITCACSSVAGSVLRQLLLAVWAPDQWVPRNPDARLAD